MDITQAKLDAVVIDGTDHELFISGYLHGHFSLIVSQVESNDQCSVEELDRQLLLSLHNAFENGELEKADQQDVFAMWKSLVSRC